MLSAALLALFTTAALALLAWAEVPARDADLLFGAHLHQAR